MSTATEIRRIVASDICTEGLINLLEAFLDDIQKSYISALDMYVHNKNIGDSDRLYKKIRSYILSDDFALLTNLDGEFVVQKLDDMYMKGYRVAV